MRDTHLNLRQKHIEFPEPERAVVGNATRESIVSTGLFAPMARRQGIWLCGTSDAELPFYFVRHYPSMWQVLVTVSGVGEVWSIKTARWELLPAGFCYVTPPNTLHAYRAIPGESWRIAWAHIAPGTVPVLCESPVILAGETESFAASIQGLYRESLQPMPGDAFVVESWVFLVRAYALRLCALASAKERGAITGDVRIARLFARIATNLDHAWTLDEMALEANISTEHLRRLCRAEGMDSPLRRVTELRLRHAAALLASGFYTVERAAQRVGYSNPYAFSTAFKRFFGQPPSKFQAKDKQSQ